VREYATPAAFRAAVEATLRERARRLKVPAYIVRRQAALERLMVRLTSALARIDPLLLAKSDPVSKHDLKLRST